MKKCPVCAIELPPNAPYCPQCGTSAMLLQSERMMTGNKALDMLVGFAISFGLLFGSGILVGLLASLSAALAWLYVLPLIGTLLATLYAYRRFRFIAFGMLIPLLILLLVVLGVLVLCGGFH